MILHANSGSRRWLYLSELGQASLLERGQRDAFAKLIQFQAYIIL